MSLRDWFAGQALIGILSGMNLEDLESQLVQAEVVSKAFEIGSLMLRE